MAFSRIRQLPARWRLRCRQLFRVLKIFAAQRKDDDHVLFTIGNKSVNASGEYVEPSFFTCLRYHLFKGMQATPFRNYIHSCLQKTAQKFFGDEKKVIGKTVSMDNKQDYVVSGVLKDIPENSTIQFEWLAPFKVWYDANRRA